MKKYIFITIVAALLFSCEKDFLDRVPETDITAAGFFNSTSDLEIYTNTFYDYFGASTRDLSTDDQTRHSEGDGLNSLLKGNLTLSNADNWDGWDVLRDINYFLANYNNNNISENGNMTEINHYIAFARFSRARWYISKIKDYGMVPWIDKPLNVDSEELFKTQDSRDFVVEKIMEDLEFAVANLKESTNFKSQISKWSALAEMSRFCLYEGTFRKYHDYTGLSNANTYLTKSAEASQQIIDSGNYSIWTNGNPNTAYNEFFIQESYNGNSEVIQSIEYSYDEPRRTYGVVVYFYWGLSKNLVDSYLMTDGTRFTDVSGFDEKGFVEVFENRDPRMAQTIAYPGYKFPNTENDYLIVATYGGYTQQKFLHNDENESLWNSQNDLAAYRYAEVLLNHAEAKAELGTLSQGDIDATINAIRARVGMPGLNMAAANANPDPVQTVQYPNVSGANVGVIMEIRRERRIELACEGFRRGDMVRWKNGITLAQPQVGMYVPAFGGIDVTGDGTPDIAILNSPSETGPIDALPNAAELVKYYVSDGSFYLTDGDSGYIAMTGDVAQPKSFVEPKYYYYPMGINDLLVNPNLVQVPYWE
ncbi:RagB/SusD family nutrient uptake outer membrane protein [Flavivirga spongiicola]|uniref:RagB/SusD family nutrient uptake outer membrane protein n=1 Tax=Flavivirga spongiicola TaxID=421621 RepID=A0ABU7XNU8_9FLAO|nr:RagB/SusD family nutrient uptake outer membrane protein [Flavivirga sp. MEBiC05379]MDO5977442.1 RagB/SusD family nutrient uptake outer membrane protein [Flavivirga sp. MEBiC05379]